MHSLILIAELLVQNAYELKTWVRDLILKCQF